MVVDSPFPLAEHQKLLRETGQKVLAQSADMVCEATVPSIPNSLSSKASGNVFAT